MEWYCRIQEKKLDLQHQCHQWNFCPCSPGRRWRFPLTCWTSLKIFILSFEIGIYSAYYDHDLMNSFLKIRPIFSHSAIVYIVSWYLSYLISQNLTVPSALLVISSLLVFELTQMRPYTGCSCLWPPVTRDLVPLCLESQTQTCPPSQPPPIFYSWF